MSKFVVVLVTVPSSEVGSQIAQALLEQQLAACVNILAPVRSLYSWQGKLCDDEEILMLIKSKAELFENQLVPALQALHPYQTPEIIALPITMGSTSYLEWIDQVTRKSG